MWAQPVDGVLAEATPIASKAEVMGNVLELEEQVAALLVQHFTASHLERFDLGGSRRADYRINDASGTQVGVLEVTSNKSETKEAFYSQSASKLRAFEPHGVSLAWRATVDGFHRSLKDVSAALKTALPPLEEKLLQEGRSPAGGALILRESQIPVELMAVGVSELWAMDSEDEGKGFCAINSASKGGTYGVQSLNEVILEKANLPDNKVKLSDGGFARRELFVWCDPGSPAASAVTTDFLRYQTWESFAGAAVQLPEHVTRVWAGVLVGDLSKPITLGLWWSVGGPWSYVGVPLMVSDTVLRIAAATNVDEAFFSGSF